MADNLTTQSATPATVPASSVIATKDSGSGHMQIVHPGGQSAARTDVAASASSVTIIAASTTTRVGVCLYNDSNAVCSVKFGTTASASDHTIDMGPFGYYEVPYGYRGRIDGIWSAATGNMRVTEITL